MAKFNQTLEAPAKIINRAGGEAYSESAELALVNLLLTSFMKDKFYETASEEQVRLVSLLEQVDPQFVAKAALYARLEFGMRSVSHFTAAWLAGQESMRGNPKVCIPLSWQRRFFCKIVFRADDILEISAAYQRLYPDSKRPLPHAMGRGLRDAQQKLSEYTLAKYRGDGKDWNQYDIVRLEHGTSEPIGKLMHGTLPAADTWEHALSEAGREGSETTTKDEWGRLIKEGKLGYFALLRNIRNILLAELPEDVIAAFFAQLVDPYAIKRSKVLPFRFLTAIQALQSASLSSEWTGKALGAISAAVEIALSNVPTLSGRTLIALDDSSSMMTNPINQGPENKRGGMIAPVMAAEAGGLFAAAMVKQQNADMMLFSDTAYYFTMNPADSLLGMVGSIRWRPLGTNFHAVFQAANRQYDRIIFLTDGQGWIGQSEPDRYGWTTSSTPERSLQLYCERYNCRPHVYSWNLCAYGDAQFKEDRIYALAGFSDKVFDTMRMFETDRNAMINMIKAIEI